MSYIQFVPRPQDPNRKTTVYDVISSTRTNLGIVAFFPRWRKFVCEFQPKCVFDSSCLQEITDFVKARTADWKAGQ
jgi:hypothetical protein